LKSNFLIAACAALLLCAGSAGATTLDFSGHHDDNNQSDYSKGDYNDQGNNGNSWNDQSGKNDQSNNGDNGQWQSGGYSLPSGQSWNGHSDGGDPGGNKNKKDHVPPPLCATADPNNHGDKYGDGKDDGKFGYKFVKYYASVCDGGKDGKGDPWHHHPGCDPGDPVPLPDALPMFGLACVFLAGFSFYKKMRSSGRLAR